MSLFGGVPPLSFRLFWFSRRKLTGEADRAAVKAVTSVSFVLEVGETQVQGVTGVTPSSATAPVRGPSATSTSHCPGPAPRSTDRTATSGTVWEGRCPLCGPAWRLAPGRGSSLFSQGRSWPPGRAVTHWTLAAARTSWNVGFAVGKDSDVCLEPRLGSEMGGRRWQRERGREPGKRCLSEAARPHGVAAPPVGTRASCTPRRSRRSGL